MRIVIADDAVLIREGIAGLLTRLGHEIVATAVDAVEMKTVIDKLADNLPDILISDVRMPPNMTDDGLHAVMELRERYPNLAVMVLSQFLAPVYATELMATKTGAGVGYLLKDRVSRVQDFVNSLQVVAQGGLVIDPEIAATMVTSRKSVLHQLTEREREVLEYMAQGLSNSEIEKKMFLSKAAVARYVAAVFGKFGLEPTEENRRVKVVLAYLSENPLNFPKL